MKGFIVRSTTWKGQTRRIGISGNDTTGIYFNVNRLHEVFWSLGGFKMPEEEHWIWDGGNLKVGDEIDVEVAEFEEATPPVAIESSTCPIPVKTCDDSRFQEIELEEYYRLKRLLEDEGWIEEEYI